RKSTVVYASGKILFDVPDRHPGGTRTAKAAPFARHTIDGAATIAEIDGTVTWAGTANASVAPGLVGPAITIANKAGTLAADALTLPDGGSLTWSKATDEFGDAQLSSFVFASQAKAFVHANIDPNLAWADTSMLPVNVNINQTCNANYNGVSINFYRATTALTGTQCQNTGRIADVVYHEFGHSVHHHAVIDGVGNVDGGVGEGMADVLAALITGDHGMGRGFFFNDTALRDLDPAGQELRYPEDLQGEVHADGEIVGEAFWDMKKALIAKLGATAGEAQARKIYYGIIQRSVDIPTTYVEALVSDDDDGDLSNGTPNMCAINEGYGAHGLANAASALGLTPPARDNFTISFTANPPSGASACANTATLTKATIEWKKRDGAMNVVDLVAAGSSYSGVIPTQPKGTVVQYKVVITLSDGSSISYPNNAADPFYEFYVGDVEKLWCADFESGAADWTHGAVPSNRDEWQAGPPQGLGGDPRDAYAGTSVFGIDLQGDGIYRTSVMTWAESPEIDLKGHTDVRLQYYRWLGVEDGVFDNARVLVNGTKLWSNFASPAETMNGLDHVDKEWRFQDIELTSLAATGKVKLRFELDSDQGLEYGGWTMDEVCVVAAAPAPTCGNGNVDDGESCDDGNIDDGDGCTPTCNLPGEDDTGCCSVGATPGGAALLSLFTIGMLIRRRRRS
ncbi:MAG: MYXO-CTERM sorting domain-containing protein, partial [Polyangiales bacterium]